jgi:RNA polymerase subunit RPABC4/transcription elongation factor Spt4
MQTVGEGKMASEEFECQKCGKVTPIRVCPNCGIGTVWKHASALGSGGSKASVTRLEARSDQRNHWFDFLIIVLSVAVPLCGFQD